MYPQEVDPRRDDVQFIDLREPSEWDAGHVEDAVHIAMGELGSRQDELARTRPERWADGRGDMSG